VFIRVRVDISRSSSRSELLVEQRIGRGKEGYVGLLPIRPLDGVVAGERRAVQVVLVAKQHHPAAPTIGNGVGRQRRLVILAWVRAVMRVSRVQQIPQ
jgi:hypothetical protein